MRYAHTNIVAFDWQKLVQFYCEVFSCVPVPPRRNQSGSWLDRGTGVAGAEIQGMHLKLPGHGPSGPTLEIYQYSQIESAPAAVPNRAGIGHLAFEVDDVQLVVRQIVRHGGSAIGEISSTNVEGVGELTFVYMADPEGNVLEIQQWE